MSLNDNMSPEAKTQLAKITLEPQSRTGDEDPNATNRDLEKGDQVPRRLTEHSPDSLHGRPSISNPRLEKSGPAATNAAVVDFETGLPPEEAVALEELKPLILQIIDLGFGHGSKPIHQAKCANKDHIEHCLESLPILAPNTARIFICDFYISRRKFPGKALRAYLQSLGLVDIAAARESDISSFARLAPQWQENSNPPCLGVRTCDEFTSHMQCIPLDTDKLIVLHSFPALENDNEWRMKWTEKLVLSISESNCFCYLNGVRKDFSKFVVLNFLNLALKSSNKSLEDDQRSIKNDIEMYGRQYIDYGDTVQEYHRVESNYYTFKDTAQDLVEAIEFVISSITSSVSVTRDLGENTITTEVKNPSVGLQELFEDIRGCCKQQLRLADRINAYHKRRYNLYLSTLNIHESESLKRLTALATGFLPLSLGAGLLSMQTRFADLNYLLYDFVGVGLLLFFLMGMVYILLKLLLRTTKWRPFGRLVINLRTFELTPEERKKLELKQKAAPFFRLVFRGMYMAAGIYIMATFLVGMFDDIPIGLKTLGFGAAAVLALVLLVMGVTLLPMSSRLFSRLAGKTNNLSSEEEEEEEQEDFNDSDTSEENDYF